VRRIEAPWVENFAMQSPEDRMEDFGSGKLARGVAVLEIAPAFALTRGEIADDCVFLREGKGCKQP
jgi:hypothetical protein